jgi:hypothetical protein
MSQKNVKAPRLPSAPLEYDQRFMDQFLSILRLYFNQLDNAGPMAASTQRVDGGIVAGLSFIQPDPTTPNAFTVSLPTQADLSNLRVGDVYYDTTAGNVLKVKT